MADTYRAAAERMLAGVKRRFTREPIYRFAQPSEFPHLQLRAYRRIEQTLAARGFRHLVDLELVHVSTAPDARSAPTLLRSYASADGTIAASHYRVARSIASPSAD